ncbi:MAG: NHLP leader peptide family RiPP precursor [Bacteroidota bacterium]
MDFVQKKENFEKNLNTLISKCWEDETFKHELIANPVEAIEKLSGKPLDLNGKKIVVTDQTDPATVHINIPSNPNDMELTEAELETVAGGGFSLELLWSGICIAWD